MTGIEQMAVCWWLHFWLVAEAGREALRLRQAAIAADRYL